jgi:hypothetical protein
VQIQWNFVSFGLTLRWNFAQKNENVSGKEERKNLYLGGTLAESEGTTEQRDIGRAGEASDDIHGLGPHWH